MSKIAVIGDVMLDKYDFCRNRDNPESSAPCYTVERTEFRLGGAGNVAANLKKLGDSVVLIGVVGEDWASHEIGRILKSQGLDNLLIRDPSRATIVKERVLSASDGRYHFRKDIEKKQYIGEHHVRGILENLGDIQDVIISDYNKGSISLDLMQQLKARGYRVFVDPKPNHSEFYQGVFLLTPNVKEAIEMTGLSNDLEAAQQISTRLGSRVLLTRSERGVSYFGRVGDPDQRFDLPTEAKKVFDVTGAGDTVIATLVHFLSKGAGMREAVRLANKAAGIAVGYPGCYQVSEEELLD